MLDPKSYYQKNIVDFKTKITNLYKKLLIFSGLRLFTFLATAIGVFLAYENLMVTIAILVFGIGIFLLLLSKYTDHKKRHAFFKSLLDINEVEIQLMSGNFLHLPNGTIYKDPNHFYSEDIDLFGNGSFFQYINRTKISAGSDELAKNLLANNIEDILKRQDSIKELSSMPNWNQKFSANAQLIKVDTPSIKIEKWLTNYAPFLSKNLKWLPLVFSFGSLSLIALVSLDIVSISILAYYFFLGLIITGKFFKKTNDLSRSADMARDTIKQYSVLMKQIETTNFKSELLLLNKNKLSKTGLKASELFKKFGSLLDSFDNRNNFIYAIVANGFFLADLYNAIKVEKWILINKELIPEWFQVITFFDSQISLGVFAFNHPNFTYPKLSVSDFVISAKELGHPLLKADKRINNDLEIQNEEFFIITGANMAGKSTFLRTVSLHIVMANTGLPVCATESIYSPIKLITSMRTNDSLKDESSYFFAELTRLKFIVESIKKDSYFIILDEILKGTNSTDKAIGSRKFVERLVENNATGLIATHDLSLCEIATELGEVKNFYFDAEIIDDELYFDYTFKNGICKNMNASFLLKKMEII